MKDQFTDYNKQPVTDKYEEPRNIFVSIQSVKNTCTNKLELHKVTIYGLSWLLRLIQ